MKQLIVIIGLAMTFSGLTAQTLFVKKEFCKKKEVEIISGNKMPNGYAIVGFGSIERADNIDSIDKLSAKQIKKMKSYGKMFKSCRVFVDFKGEIIGLKEKNGKDSRL